MISYGTSPWRWAGQSLGGLDEPGPWALAHGVTMGSAVHRRIGGCLERWISGGIITVIAAAALYQVQTWEEWTNVVVGAWLVVSPWILGFTNLPVATWNAVIVGLLVLCVAGWELYALPREARMHR